MLQTPSEELIVRRTHRVNLWQLIQLVLATMLVTIGLAMVLSDVGDIVDVVRSVIVVFGGAAAGVLLSFRFSQTVQALQAALDRGLLGGYSPGDMVRAMLKVCEVSKRDGLLGVAEIESDCAEVEDVCQLIGEAADDAQIRFALERSVATEKLCHSSTSDVFLFTAIYASLFGLLASLLRYGNSTAETVSGSVYLPFVCGASLAIIMSVLIARLRAAHLRQLMLIEIAHQSAAIILEDNNVQRLYARLSMLIPAGLKG